MALTDEQVYGSRTIGGGAPPAPTADDLRAAYAAYHPTEDPYGSRTMGSRPAPLGIYPPAPVAPAPPKVVDRVAFLTERSKFAQQIEQQRKEAVWGEENKRQAAFDAYAAPFADVRNAYGQAQRIAEVVQRDENIAQQQALRLSNGASYEQYVGPDVSNAPTDVSGNDYARELAIQRGDTPYGRRNNVLSVPIPGVNRVKGVVQAGVSGALKGAYALTPAASPALTPSGTTAERDRAAVLGGELSASVIPANVGQALIAISPGIGDLRGVGSFVSKEIMPTLRLLAKDAGMQVEEYVASRAGREALANLLEKRGIPTIAGASQTPEELAALGGEAGARADDVRRAMEAQSRGEISAADLGEIMAGRKTLRDIPIEAGARAGDAESALPALTTDNLPSSPVPKGPYLEPPEVPKLSERFPLVEPSGRAAAGLAEAQTQSSGDMLRAPANALAEKVDDLITRKQDGPASIATRLLEWVSNEATRFRGPLNEGITEYKRSLAAGDAWATETGNVMGRKAKDAFGKPNAVYIATDGQPVFVKTPDGANIKLLNRDVLENAHVPEVARRMTPEQQKIAAETGEMLSRLRGEARKSGARLGAARSVDGTEVTSYVHRTAIDKDGIRFLEYGDPAKPGAKLHAENARDYVTAAEGVQDGVRYVDSWQEEYVSHLRALRKHEANAALKEWTDSVSETLGERIARLNPAAANAREAAATTFKDARRVLAQRQAAIAQRLRKDAETSVRQARKAVSRAQRQLDRATSAEKLDKVEVRVPDAMKIGEARERLAAAIKAGDQRGIKFAQQRLDGLTTQAALQTEVLPRDTLIQNVGKAREELAAATKDLRESADQSIDALYRRMDDADRNAILTARADVEEAVAAKQAAGKTYRAERNQAEEGLGRTVMRSPGGQQLPITAGRYFNPEDARVLAEFAKDVADRNAPVHPAIAALRLATAPMNYVILTADNSFVGVQGMLTMVLAPEKWAKMVVQAPLMAASPRFRARWMLNHEEGVRWVQKYAPHAFDANPDFAARGSLTSGIAKKVPVVSQLNQLFQDGRTMSAVHLAEVYMKDAKNDQEAFELASAIGKVVGVSRTVGAEKDLLLAAGFFRSKIGLMGDAITNGGLQGGMARTALGRLMGGAALATLGYQMYVKGERDPKKLVASITPGKDGAFEIEGINLLGTFSTELNTLGRLVMEPKDALGTAKFYGRSKLNMPLGSALSSWQGKDILGRPTSWREEFGGKGYFPLSAQQYQEWELRGAPREIAIPAAIFGIKYNPPTAYENLANSLKAKGIEPDVFFGEAGTRKQAMDDFPELRPLHEKWEQSRRIGSIDQRKAQGIVDASRAKIEAKITEVVTRKATPTDLKDFTKAESAQRRITRDALFPDRDGQDARLDPLYQAYDDAVDPDTGELDFDKALQIQESYLSQHEDLRPLWEQQQYVPYTDNPVEAKLMDGKRLVNQKMQIASDANVSWYGVQDVAWDSAKHSSPTAQQYDTYTDYARAMGFTSLEVGFDAGKMAGGDPLSKSISDFTKVIHQTMLIKDPALGANLRVWYGVDLPDSDLPEGAQAALAEETRRLIASILEAQ